LKTGQKSKTGQKRAKSSKPGDSGNPANITIKKNLYFKAHNLNIVFHQKQILN
jgi:hypothetical protein